MWIQGIPAVKRFQSSKLSYQLSVATLANIPRQAIIDGDHPRPRTLHFSAMVGRSVRNNFGNDAKISSDGATTTVSLVPHNPAFLPRCGIASAITSEALSTRSRASLRSLRWWRLIARTDVIRGTTEHLHCENGQLARKPHVPPPLFSRPNPVSSPLVSRLSSVPYRSGPARASPNNTVPSILSTLEETQECNIGKQF